MQLTKLKLYTIKKLYMHIKIHIIDSLSYITNTFICLKFKEMIIRMKLNSMNLRMTTISKLYNIKEIKF